MKLSERPHFKAKIEKFKEDVARAKAKGIDILPSVDGPCAVKDGRVIGRYRSKEYEDAIS
jgi:hypothetical protein